MQLNVEIKKRVATYKEGTETPICGNSGDTIVFSFDDEWAEHEQKTARFIWGNKHYDVEFTGDTCEVPVVTNTQSILVGVYVGEEPDDEPLLSSTLTAIPYALSARCVKTSEITGKGNKYTNEAKGFAIEAQGAAETAQGAAKTAQGAAETAQGAISNLAQYKGLEVIGQFTIESGATPHATYGFVISEDTKKLIEKGRLIRMVYADGAKTVYPLTIGYVNEQGASVNRTSSGTYYLKLDSHAEARIKNIGAASGVVYK